MGKGRGLQNETERTWEYRGVVWINGVERKSTQSFKREKNCRRAYMVFEKRGGRKTGARGQAHARKV